MDFPILRRTMAIYLCVRRAPIGLAGIRSRRAESNARSGGDPRQCHRL